MDRILIFNPLPVGGITDYLHFQANALENEGVQVTMITCPGFKRRSETNYKIECILPAIPRGNLAVLRKIRHIIKIVSDFSILKHYAIENQYNFVLIGAFAEYASPLWTRVLKKLKRSGVTLGCVIHDPVRDFQIGPRWLHRLSIKLHYESIDICFVHHSIALEMFGATPRPGVVTIPFPSYPFEDSQDFLHNFRSEFGIPEDDLVLLSFGHIRNDKNIDLVLEAICEHPRVHLIQAGKEQSSEARPAAYYRRLAEELGIGERFHIINRFIAQNELKCLFESSDFAILTYSAKFHSGSAALGACANYKKCMLVSASEGPMIQAVSSYGLGVCVAPDSSSAISAGITELINADFAPRWEDFTRENSWEINISKVIAAFSAVKNR
jgi:glycosyltransferase involved in cell wall biosynthesis